MRPTIIRVAKGIKTIKSFSTWGSFILFHNLPNIFLIIFSVNRLGCVKTATVIVTNQAGKVNKAKFQVALVICTALC